MESEPESIKLLSDQFLNIVCKMVDNIPESEDCLGSGGYWATIQTDPEVKKYITCQCEHCRSKNIYLFEWVGLTVCREKEQCIKGHLIERINKLILNKHATNYVHSLEQIKEQLELII